MDTGRQDPMDEHILYTRADTHMKYVIAGIFIAGIVAAVLSWVF